jgi:hypothetical protein
MPKPPICVFFFLIYPNFFFPPLTFLFFFFYPLTFFFFYFFFFYFHSSHACVHPPIRRARMNACSSLVHGPSRAKPKWNASLARMTQESHFYGRARADRVYLHVEKQRSHTEQRALISFERGCICFCVSISGVAAETAAARADFIRAGLHLLLRQHQRCCGRNGSSAR